MKFLKATVIRSAYADVYIAVPDDFDKSTLCRYRFQQELGRIAKETTSNSDWEPETEWQNDIELSVVEEVPEAEATNYSFGTLNIEGTQ